MKFKTCIGQDSHRFLKEGSTKPCVIGGITFEDVPGFQANSDGDIVFHALCNAITSLTHVLVLGGIADQLCMKDGLIDSALYLKEALKTLPPETSICHVSITLEGKRPYFKEKILAMRKNTAEVLGISLEDVGITATSGEGLTDFGCGDGVMCFAAISFQTP